MLEDKIYKQGKKVKKASKILEHTSLIERNNILKKISELLIFNKDEILKENKKDVLIAIKNKMSKTMIDRLELTTLKIENMVKSLNNIIFFDDPIGNIIKSWRTKDNIDINMIKVPIGVIGMIFESRPNVLIDSVGLAIKSGNSILLKGSSSAKYSNKILNSIVKNALIKNNFYEGIVQLIDSNKRKSVDIMIKMNKYIDLIIPRGGKSLIENVVNNSNIPIIQTGTGICHCYVDCNCDLNIAANIIINGKLQRPSVCNSLETLLIHKNIFKKIIPYIEEHFIEKKVEIRACEKSYKFFKNAKKAKKEDFGKEFLDYIIAIKIVEDIDEAINHINKFSSKHSEVIISNNYKNIRIFQRKIDSSCVFVNVSTRFSDGEAFGFGAEIGISTQKIHARGPMGLDSLTTIKYLINGNGQVRK